MADQSPYPYPSPTTQLEQLAGAAQQASSPGPEYTPQRPANPRKRKAESGSGSSRGVANLTPEQLAKKRANDREAQRAIRERTRNTIESLETRIKELESQQPFQELQNVIRSRDAVVAENEELKRRLANICALAQPQNSVNHGLNDLALATSQQSPLPMPAQGPQSHQGSQHASPYEAPQTLNQHHLHPELRNLASYQAAPTANMHSQLLNDPSPDGDRSFNHNHEPKASAASPLPPRDVPYYARLPLNTAPTCPLDTILLDFFNDRRALLDRGHNQESIIGPAELALRSMVNHDYIHEAHPVSVVILDILSKFPDLHDMPEMIGSYWTMFLFVRWQLAPTQELYDTMPEWLRPTQLQIERPHPAWVDRVPWPDVRDRLIADQEKYPFENFLVPYTTTMSLNWPYGDEACIIEAGNRGVHADGQLPALVLSPEFEAHMRDIGNWTIGPAFAKAFPELVTFDNPKVRDVRKATPA